MRHGRKPLPCVLRIDFPDDKAMIIKCVGVELAKRKFQEEGIGYGSVATITTQDGKARKFALGLRGGVVRIKAPEGGVSKVTP